VVNYDVPATPEAYIHRIGRTGRAEQKGKAYNLVTNDDFPIVRSIDKILGARVEQRTLPDFDYGAAIRPTPEKMTRSARPWKLR
jgi:ATP-dependent RNA helicase RhlE